MTENQGQLPILAGNKGRYQLLKPLGKGSFGDTFLAIDLDTMNQRHCVVKRLRIESHHSPEIIAGIKKAFEKEAKVLEDLGVRSGNIPCLYDYFSLTVTDPQLHTSQEFYYLVQQYIEGEDLSKELEQQGRFSETKVLALLNNILPVLEFIHKNNVIHRDIKPSNIVRSQAKAEDNKFYLIDFGAVKQVIEGKIYTTEISMVFGTLAYAPLEQIRKKKVDYSSDLYALAASCVELLTGEFPEDSRDVNNLWNWQKYPHISEHLGKILRRMLQEDPYYRFQSAREVMEALNKRDDQQKELKPSNGDENNGGGEKTIIISPSQPRFIQVLLITATILTTAGVLIAIYRHQNQVPPGEIQTIPGQLFEDKQFGIEIKYPQDWKAEKQQYSPITGGTIAKISPNSSSLNLDVGLFIRVVLIEKSQSLSEYNLAAIEQIQKSVKDVQILQQQPIKIDNREGYQIVYRGQEQIGNFRFKVMEIWTISNSKVYILTYRAEEKLYDPFLKDVEQTMIKSFHLQSTLFL
ncbi:serine/threonine protein kinase [Dolichospermum sp. LEGE 00240]|jgi:serine/threonine protein kinase|uniref:serine/threonine-protein kinase n=1 Tax=Dolichospermum sp. LEGE 00240 TaxID=1828603 RepID=UPI00187E33A2|nr:serine/threonine-protein kinase [Dolichospermum sp. LEGE 00240]MBE9247773.1 serine/threonine protein kinase [Dolichospermum sp. LEGE 00240]MDM3843510.1 protein kinase [Aphanizomenon gracile PMC638.10]MDM3848919.1 protein kinase [Aphanizomenon gracile PMC627.10]